MFISNFQIFVYITSMLLLYVADGKLLTLDEVMKGSRLAEVTVHMVCNRKVEKEGNYNEFIAYAMLRLQFSHA